MITHTEHMGYCLLDAVLLPHWAQALTICAALAMNTVATSCSDDNDKPAKNEDPEVTYQGNVAYSKGVLFAEGTQLGNGSLHFHFTGDVTLPKGTYLLKGWVYVDAGATLRIPAGTIIKGDRQTMASLIVEPGGYVEMKGTKNAPIVMTSAQPAGQRRPGDWGGLIICGKARNSDFENNSSYITAGSVYPDNGSKLGRFQAAMHLRRSTQLNATGVLAVGYYLASLLYHIVLKQYIIIFFIYK